MDATFSAALSTDLPLKHTNLYGHHSSITSKTTGLSRLLPLLIGERPNTDASFSVSFGSDLSLPPSVANVLRPDGIAELLKNYPNQRFVDTLTSIAISGARIGFQGQTSGRVQCPNHTTASAHPQIITESIQNELRKGRIKQISDLPDDVFCSPIGLVPKQANGVQSGWRVIFDLSSPEGSSVKDGIPKEFGTIVYETLNDAVQLVAQAGKGAVMMKRDLKAAFRHVPMNPCDYWLLVFKWNGQFYVDMFLPFGLQTAPRIFNLFAEALHWVLETLFEWNVTHYLDDFLFVFPPGTEITPLSTQFDEVLAKFGLTKVIEKDSDGCVVVHLGFEFDSASMQVRLPPDKKQCAVKAINTLLSSSTVTLSMLESTLGFLSHCCQVVPLGRPFLRNLFSQTCRSQARQHLTRIRLNHNSRRDLRWWLQFLTSWSSISLIQLSRPIFDVATDTSGAKGIGGVHSHIVFSEQIPSRHKAKKIDWKELFAVLHAFMLWHEGWKGGTVRLACDNSSVVDAINKHSIKGPAIVPLQRIFLIAAVHNIQILPFWIPSRENIVADAASHFDYKKLANLGLQVPRDLPRPALLRQKLHSFFTTPSLLPHSKTTTISAESTRPSAKNTVTLPTLPPLKHYRTGLPKSYRSSSPQPQNRIEAPLSPSTCKRESQLTDSQTNASILSFVEVDGFMETAPKPSDIPSHPISSSAWLTKSQATKKELMSKRHSVWALLHSYDLVNLHGIHGPRNPIIPSSPDATLLSTPRQ